MEKETTATQTIVTETPTTPISTKQPPTKIKTTKGYLAKLNRRNGLFIIPFMVVFVLFTLYPIIRTFIMSFTKYKGYGTETPVGLENYIRSFSDKLFWQSFGNTWKIWGLNIIIQLGLAMLLTIVFSDLKYRVKGLTFWRAIFYLPGIIAATSVARLFQYLFDWKYGSVNQILYKAGFIQEFTNWLGFAETAQPLVSVIQAWMWFGNSFLLLMAAVQGISKEYYEAASIDGAGRWTIYFKITLPLIRPVMLYVAITSIIGGLQLFDIPMLLGTHVGNPSGSLLTMVLYQYSMAFKYRQLGYASALAFVLFLMIAVFSVAAYFLMYGKKGEE